MCHRIYSQSVMAFCGGVDVFGESDQPHVQGFGKVGCEIPAPKLDHGAI
jgi:hypothetical protein